MGDMVNIKVTRYERGFVDGLPRAGEEWQGHIEPADRSWIMFVRRDGTPVVFLHRDPATGAVLDAPQGVLPIGG